MKNNILKNEKGFTLIEVLIAVGLFVIVMTMGVASVLQVNTAYKKSQQQRAIMDTLSFVMEDMVRNTALGSSINCQASIGNPGPNESFVNSNLGILNDDFGCNGVFAISFIPFNDPAIRTAYAFIPSGLDSLRLYKSIDNGNTFSPITPAEIKLDVAKSGFKVVGAQNAPGDNIQPRVTIRLAGKMFFKGVESPFDLQTTVSQRLIDGE